MEREQPYNQKTKSNSLLTSVSYIKMRAYLYPKREGKLYFLPVMHKPSVNKQQRFVEFVQWKKNS